MQIDEAGFRKRFPHASAAFLARNGIRANSAGGAPLCADNPQPTQGDALVSPAPRKGKGRKGAVLGAPIRRSITFRVYAVRPADWDGYSIKELQDMLVHAGILDGDAWHSLQGTVISTKVYEKEQERTVIEIT